MNASIHISCFDHDGATSRSGISILKHMLQNNNDKHILNEPVQACWSSSQLGWYNVIKNYGLQLVRIKSKDEN